MTSTTAILARHKIDTVFDGGTVVHKTYKSNLHTRQRKVTVKTTWTREKELGSGAFGIVWRERQEGSQELRAVKVVSKRQLNVREVDALAELQDVRAIPPSTA